MFKLAQSLSNNLKQAFYGRSDEFDEPIAGSDKSEHRSRFINVMANMLYYHLNIKDEGLIRFTDQNKIQEYTKNDKDYFYNNFYLANIGKLMSYGANLALAKEIKNLESFLEPKCLEEIKEHLLKIYNLNSSQKEVLESLENINKIGFKYGVTEELTSKSYLFLLNVPDMLFISNPKSFKRAVTKKLFKADSFPIEYTSLSDSFKNTFSVNIKDSINKELHNLYASEYRILSGFEVTKTSGKEIIYRGEKNFFIRHNIGRQHNNPFDSMFTYHMPAEFNGKWKGDDACFATSASLSLKSCINYATRYGYILDIRPPKDTEVVNLMNYHTENLDLNRSYNLEVTFDVIDLSWIRALYRINRHGDKIEIANVYLNPYYRERGDEKELPIAKEAYSFSQQDRTYLPFNIHTHLPDSNEYKAILNNTYFNKFDLNNPPLDVPHLLENGELVRCENYNNEIIQKRRNAELDKIQQLFNKSFGERKDLIVANNQVDPSNIIEQEVPAQKVNQNADVIKEKVFEEKPKEPESTFININHENKVNEQNSVNKQISLDNKNKSSNKLSNFLKKIRSFFRKLFKSSSKKNNSSAKDVSENPYIISSKKAKDLEKALQRTNNKKSRKKSKSKGVKR